MFFQQLDVVCPNATAGPRLRTHEDEYGISALIWGDGTSALVLIVDRRAVNKGRSATNAAGALVRLIFEQALEHRAIPWCNTRWVERDSEGHFDHMLVDSWLDDGVPRLGFPRAAGVTSTRSRTTSRPWRSCWTGHWLSTSRPCSTAPTTSSHRERAHSRGFRVQQMRSGADSVGNGFPG